jgi:Ca2+-binding EF-hand superfamily protein
VFRFFDRDGSGVISAGEFRHSCDLLNDLLPGAGTHIATHARTQ